MGGAEQVVGARGGGQRSSGMQGSKGMASCAAQCFVAMRLIADACGHDQAELHDMPKCLHVNMDYL